MESISKEDGYYYSDDEIVDIYNKKQDIKPLEISKDLKTGFKQFIRNIVMKSVLDRYPFKNLHENISEFYNMTQNLPKSKVGDDC